MEDSKCSCVAGSLGYCNHSLASILRLVNLAYMCPNTLDLENEADQIPERACTSKLPTWNQKARGETIYPKPTVDVIFSKNKLEETKTKEFILSFTRQEIRSGTTVQRRKRFKQVIRNIKPSNGSC